ncbi:MAG: acyl-CoA thioesterase [Lachnospiraceae bacterium]|nr:acyl-CoA thioesterase [Lachnospiraceae bacterium]
MKPFEWKAQYYETDQMGIVHHSNYIRWFESARIDFMAQMGIPYEKMEEAGIISPVLTVSCQYRKMTHFGDTVEIVPSVKAYNGIRLVISYMIRQKETGEVIADGETSHCFLNREGKIVSLKKVLPETHAVFEAYTEKGK